MSVPLPEFDNPPVTEVVLGVQFDPLDSIRSPQLGYVWQIFRDRFPATEEHPPLEPQIEQFGVKAGTEQGVRFELLTSLPTPRVWFLNGSGTELVQLQKDRFVRNWRKTDAVKAYPRYTFLRQQFVSDFDAFRGLVERENWGCLESNQCEVTYVNIIPCGRGWTEPGELAKVFTMFTPSYSDEGLGLPDGCELSARFVLENDGGEPVGRLHVAVASVVQVIDGSSAFRLTLTARGRPEGIGVEGILRSLDRGHEAIVRGFASITTPQMHAIWGRKL